MKYTTGVVACSVRLGWADEMNGKDGEGVWVERVFPSMTMTRCTSLV